MAERSAVPGQIFGILPRKKCGVKWLGFHVIEGTFIQLGSVWHNVTTLGKQKSLLQENWQDSQVVMLG